jgi:transglutaminase-like putative cysteine protease
VSPTVGFDYTPYLVATKNCQVDNKIIKNQTDSLTAGLITDLAKATAIYKYVRDNIDTVTDKDGLILDSDHNYIYGNETWRGAIGTLSGKKGNDADQAHLLIAMLRTAGIPARYCYGSCIFRGSTYKMANLLGSEYMDHVWAECALNDKWIVLDPTCEAVFDCTSDYDYFNKLYPENGFGKINTWDYKNYKLHGYYASLPF